MSIVLVLPEQWVELAMDMVSGVIIQVETVYVYVLNTQYS